MVTIQTRDSLNIRKSKLDYRGLKELVEKLEGLCWRFRVWRISVILPVFTICATRLLVFPRSSVSVITEITFPMMFIFPCRKAKRIFKFFIDSLTFTICMRRVLRTVTVLCELKWKKALQVIRLTGKVLYLCLKVPWLELYGYNN